LKQLPPGIKQMERKNKCGEPGEPSCGENVAKDEGYGIDSDDDNTYIASVHGNRNNNAHKTQTYRQAQLGGPSGRTDFNMYQSGEFGDKCGISPVQDSEYPPCGASQFCNFEGGKFGLCVSCHKENQYTDELCLSQDHKDAKADCKSKCTTNPTPNPPPSPAVTQPAYPITDNTPFRPTSAHQHYFGSDKIISTYTTVSPSYDHHSDTSSVPYDGDTSSEPYDTSIAGHFHYVAPVVVTKTHHYTAPVSSQQHYGASSSFNSDGQLRQSGTTTPKEFDATHTNTKKKTSSQAAAPAGPDTLAVMGGVSLAVVAVVAVALAVVGASGKSSTGDTTNKMGSVSVEAAAACL
jgi:hypothetical protein